MSYTEEIRTTQRGCDAARSHVAITSFAGGLANGPMVQITVGEHYVTLTQAELKKLRKVLKYAQKNQTLHGYVDKAAVTERERNTWRAAKVNAYLRSNHDLC